MQAARDGAEALEADIRRFLSIEDSSGFKARLVSLLLRLPMEEWETLERYARELLDGAPSTPEQRAQARTDAYYQEVLAEEKAADSSSASPSTDVKEA